MGVANFVRLYASLTFVPDFEWGSFGLDTSLIQFIIYIKISSKREPF